MKLKVVTQALVTGVLLAAVFAASAAAAPVVDKDGRLHACYRVKGKPKGAMRVVPARKRCRRGERKLAWNVSGPPSAQGGSGSQGSSGSGRAGAAGTAGSAAEVAALETKVASLSLKVEGLEGVLAGVSNSALTSAIGKVDGLTNSQLTEAVGALPAVESLCTQASALNTRVNALLTSVGGIDLVGIIPVGLGLTAPGLPLPSALPAFSCP